jgi:AbrB family looped-hinge helix DNA binding protein
MPTVKIWGRGQLTIPASIRKELHLQEETTLTIVKVGDVLVLTPRVLVGDTVAKKAARAMKKAGLRLQDLLADLITGITGQDGSYLAEVRQAGLARPAREASARSRAGCGGRSRPRPRSTAPAGLLGTRRPRRSRPIV